MELINPGHEFGYRDFPESQMAALEKLALDILSRHPIPARNVVGHSDVAPGRKQDPGERFDWARLAAAGIGLWPTDDVGEEKSDAAAMLAEYGYQTDNLTETVSAFQRHFRRQRIDGIWDAECAALLRSLQGKCE